MTVQSDIRGAGSAKEHLKKMKEVLKEMGCPTLRSHIIQLQKAWGVKIRLPKAA